MKINLHIVLLILAAAVFHACSTTASPRWVASADGTVISARGALGRLEAALSGPLYTGDGGANIRLAVLAPQVEGEVPGYLPIYIQGLLNNNFSRYSKINLIDRQNLDRIIAEQNLAASGSFSDTDFVRIGNLTNAQYFLFGTIQKLSGDIYSLQLSITDSSTGVRRANFMRDGTLSQLEGRGTLINEATAELLAQLGVELTETGKQTLIAGNTSTVLAEAGLARGITAQAGGSEIEALFNFTQAITFDPSQIEALSRLDTLSSTISGGTISQRIVNDIQARDRWIEAFKEATRFFNDHPPFEIIFDPNLRQIGETDYARRTANIGMRIGLNPSQAGFDALNALLEGLEKTGRRGVWGFSGWPLMEISPRTTGTVVFGGRRSFSYKVDVALVNEANKTIGNGSVTLTTEAIRFSAGDRMITPPVGVYDEVNFRNIRAEDLTPSLTIVIVSVNGISSQNINASGFMKIETGDLDFERPERESREQIARELAEQQQQQQQRAQVLLQEGQRKSSTGDYDGAIADYTEAIKIYPNAEAFNNRGFAYHRKGDYDRAIADYNLAIRFNPDYSNAYHNRGNSYYDKRDYIQAVSNYEAALRLDPNNATLRKDLADARPQAEQQRQAEAQREREAAERQAQAQREREAAERQARARAQRVNWEASYNNLSFGFMMMSPFNVTSPFDPFFSSDNFGFTLSLGGRNIPPDYFNTSLIFIKSLDLYSVLFDYEFGITIGNPYYFWAGIYGGIGWGITFTADWFAWKINGGIITGFNNFFLKYDMSYGTILGPTFGIGLGFFIL